MQLDAHFGLAFAAASRLIRLTSLHTSNSPAHYAKGTRSPPEGSKLPSGRLPLLVGTWFQVLFHSPPGVLFTFPSRYWFAIGRQRVFSLGRWASRIPTGFHVSRGTWDLVPGSRGAFAYGTFTLYGRPFQAAQLASRLVTPRWGLRSHLIGSHNPSRTTRAGFSVRPGLGCFPFAHRY